MICLSAGKIMESQLARSMGLDVYEELITVAPVTDVAESAEFQRKFNAFYRVRRNDVWRKVYYRLFEQAKRDHLSFADVIMGIV